MKKAQSQVVSTILLILITLAAFGFVVGFILPFVRDKLPGTECIDAAQAYTFKNNPEYTCYNDTAGEMIVQIHRGDDQNLTKGFQLLLNFQGEGESFKIEDGLGGGNPIMYDGDTILEIPNQNEERTYRFTPANANKPDSISIYPIIKEDELCDVSDTLISIKKC